MRLGRTMLKAWQIFSKAPYRNRRAVQAVSALLVVLVVGLCVTTSVEASAGAHHDCAALTTSQVTLAKTAPSAPPVWVLTIDTGVALARLPLSVETPPPLTERLAPAASTRRLTSRSPPFSP